MHCSTRAEAAVKAGDSVGDSVVAEFSPGRHMTVPAAVARVRRGDEE
jgi:hypothetical protein